MYKTMQEIEREYEGSPFYSETNMKRLQKAFDDIDAGKVTQHELVEVNDAIA